MHKRGFYMKNKKQYALNKLFNTLVILGLILAWGSIYYFIHNDYALGFGFGAAALIFIVLPSIFTPYCYAFDSEGVSICYVFLPKERYLWKNIRAIEVEDKTINYSSKSNIFDFLFATVFSIEGAPVGKRRFYMDGHIRKSFRTKYLLEKYWDGTITGYMFEDLKNWFNKRKAKKQAEIKEHLTDEVAPMEQEMRRQAKDLLKPFVAEAKQYNLEIKSKYYYITSDGEELHYRPKENYTFTLISEISRFNERDENRIVTLSIDLLYVRLGKTAYRAVKNELIEEEFKYTFSDTLNEIYKSGIEAYCKEL